MSRSKFDFARPSSHFLMSANGGSNSGKYGWGTDYMKTVFDMCPSDVQNEIISSVGANAIVTRDTVALLKNFDVEGWLEYFIHGQQGSFLDLLPLNLLWIQIIILDMAIQYMIRNGWGSPKENRQDPNPLYNEGWLDQEANIAFAISQSWRLPATPADEKRQITYADWDLAGALEKYSGMNENGDSVLLKKRVRRLADLLELRGLVWIFFMFCHADSSDVYLMANENIELPMV